MIKRILTIVAMLLVTSAANADTIDAWYIYHNKVRIAGITAFDKKKEIVIRLIEFREGDSITVQYRPCSVCGDCRVALTVCDDKLTSLLTVTGKGSSSPLSFAISELIRRRKEGYEETFDLFFAHDIHQSKNSHLIFKIKLE